MILTHRYLPYEIRRTAIQLFAGRTGFSLDEMREFFSEEIRKRVPNPRPPANEATFLSTLSYTMDSMAYDQKLQRDTFDNRQAAFDHWLSYLPLKDQKEILLLLCRKPDFPMKYRVPPEAKRNQLAALLNECVIERRVSATLQKLDSAHIMRNLGKSNGPMSERSPGRNHGYAYIA